MSKGSVSNKQIGADFENGMCALLSSMGYWVHFMAPDARGAQPFDIIAAKDGKAYAFDCKTSAVPRFSSNRIEDNQHMAFQLWKRSGNDEPKLAILYDDNVYFIEYCRFFTESIIDLREEMPFLEGFCEYVKAVSDVKSKKRNS